MEWEDPSSRYIYIYRCINDRLVLEAILNQQDILSWDQQVLLVGQITFTRDGPVPYTIKHDNIVPIEKLMHFGPQEHE
jgi:hypothetical protein